MTGTRDELRDIRARVDSLRERADALEAARRAAAAGPRIVARRGVNADRVGSAVILSRPSAPMPQWRYQRHEINLTFTVLQADLFDDEEAGHYLWESEDGVSARMTAPDVDFNVASGGARVLNASRLFLTMQKAGETPMSFTGGNVRVGYRTADSRGYAAYTQLSEKQYKQDRTGGNFWRPDLWHYDEHQIWIAPSDFGLWTWGNIHVRDIGRTGDWAHNYAVIDAPPSRDSVRGIGWVQHHGDEPVVEVRVAWSFRELVDARGNPRDPTQDDFEGDMARYVFWGMGPPANPQEPGNPET